MAKTSLTDIEKLNEETASILQTYQDALKKITPVQRGMFASLFATNKEINSEIIRLKLIARERIKQIKALQDQHKSMGLEQQKRTEIINNKQKETSGIKQATETAVRESEQRSAYLERDQQTLLGEIQANDSYVKAIQRRVDAGEAITDSEQRTLDEQKDNRTRLSEVNKKLKEEQDIRTAVRKSYKDHLEALRNLRRENTQLSGMMAALSSQIGSLETEAEGVEKELAALKFKLEFRKLLSDLAKELSQLIKAVRATQQAFGLAAGEAIQLRLTNLIASVQSYFTALIAGTTPVSRKEILRAQEDFFGEFGEIVSSQSAEALAGYAKQEGITSKMMADARRAFLTTSMGDINKAIANTNTFVGAFKSSGLSTKAAFQAIQQYSDLIARNGSRFATSFARAAADARRIGIDLNKVDQIGDNIIGNFEGFLEKSAELGAMGFGFDVNQLAALAETGNTEALFTELRSQLAMTGKDLKNLRRSEQLALSEMFGMSMAEFQRMAGITTGAGEKTQEQLTEDTNSWLTKIFNRLEAILPIAAGVKTLLSFAARTAELFLLAKIAGYTGITALKVGLLGGLPGILGRLSIGVAGLGVGIGGAMYGRSLVEQGKTGQGIALGAGAGAIGGLLLAAALAPFTGGGSLALYAGLAGGGALLAGGYSAMGMANGQKGNDVISKSGYGERTLVTPSSVIALNNDDNVVAYADDMIAQNTGIELLSKGALSAEPTAIPAPIVNVDLRGLEAKLDAVVNAIASMRVQMDGLDVGHMTVARSNAATTMGVLSKPTNTY